MDRTRLGAMNPRRRRRHGDGAWIGIPVSLLFTVVFCLGAVLAGLGGTLGAPMLNAYPGLDADMLPLALIVVIPAARLAARRIRRQLRGRFSL